MRLGKLVGFLVAAVVGFSIGYFIVTRIPPLWALLQPRQIQ